MNPNPRDIATAESYPTFWDDHALPPPASPVRADEAYAAFVSLTEDEFPADRDSEPDGWDDE